MKKKKIPSLSKEVIKLHLRSVQRVRLAVKTAFHSLHILLMSLPVLISNSNNSLAFQFEREKALSSIQKRKLQTSC